MISARAQPIGIRSYHGLCFSLECKTKSRACGLFYLLFYIPENIVVEKVGKRNIETVAYLFQRRDR